MKIIVVIGASGSGKTTYIENEIIKNRPISDYIIDNIPVSIVDDILLFGKYNVDKRCKGCDTLSMSIIDKLILTLEELIDDKKYNTIVIDGDRINNNKMLEFLKHYKRFVEVIYINTPLDIIFSRLPECNKTFVKTTYTKSKNMVHKYLQNFKVNTVQTKSTGEWF